MSIHNICFHREIRKYILWILLLTGALAMGVSDTLIRFDAKIIQIILNYYLSIVPGW